MVIAGACVESECRAAGMAEGAVNSRSCLVRMRL